MSAKKAGKTRRPPPLPGKRRVSPGRRRAARMTRRLQADDRRSPAERRPLRPPRRTPSPRAAAARSGRETGAVGDRAETQSRLPTLRPSAGPDEEKQGPRPTGSRGSGRGSGEWPGHRGPCRFGGWSALTFEPPAAPAAGTAAPLPRPSRWPRRSGPMTRPVTWPRRPGRAGGRRDRARVCGDRGDGGDGDAGRAPRGRRGQPP